MTNEELIRRIADKLNRIDEKFDKRGEQLAEINATLAAQHVSLKEHIRRTNLLEKELAKLDKRIIPVEKQVSMLHGAAKTLTIVAVALGIVKSVLTLTGN